MTFDEFISKWTSKPVDFDGVYPNQCMDLAHQYIYECLGITDKKVCTHPAAYQVFTEFDLNGVDSKYFEKTANSATGVPSKGDIVVWNKSTSVGQYGHIAIFTEGDAKKFKSFDANWPLKSLPHIQDHTYTSVLGWLRFKQIPTEIPNIDPMKVKGDYGEPWGVMELQSAKSKLNDLSRDLTAAQEKGKTLDGFVSKWVEEWKLPVGSSIVDIEGEMAKLLPLEDIAQKYRDSIEKCVGEFPNDDLLIEAHSTVRKQMDSLNKQNSDLQAKLDEAKTPVGYKFVKSWDIYSLRFKLYKKGSD